LANHKFLNWEPKHRIVRLAYSVAPWPRNFKWVEKGVLATSGQPRNNRQVGWLISKRGIKAVLSLTESGLSRRQIDSSSIEFYKQVPMVDHACPRVEELESAVSFLGGVYRRSPTLVHCLGGMGRSGVVLACFLGRVNGWSAKDAIVNVRTIWSRYIETGQERAVFEFLQS
jgi:atypical dual specificity phosphatase